MSVLTRSLPMTGMALLLTTTGALADVTAQQVWDDWQASMTAMGGFTVSTGSETLAGGVLTVSDLAMTSTSDDSTMLSTLAEVTFTEQGDGTVVVTMSPEQQIEIRTANDFGEHVLTMSVVQTDARTVASGEPGAMRYTVAIPQAVFRIDESRQDDRVIPGDIDVILSDISGDFQWSTADGLADIDYTLAIGRTDLKVALGSPEDSDTLDAHGHVADISASATMAMPTNIDPEDSAAMFAAGFAIDSTMETGEGSMAFRMTDYYGETTAAAVTLGSSRNHVQLDRAAFVYEMSTSALTVEIEEGELPFPVALTAGEVAFGMNMPMGANSEPVPFAARINLADVEVSDDLWSMVDAGGIIPRDPATVAVDISGTATLTRDLYDIEAMEDDDLPGMLHSVDINSVDLAFGGARAQAEGAFTFDADSAGMFDEMPMPEGRIDIAVAGINGLMQKLGQIGLLPPEQAMGVTMMLGMFAVPSGEDEMTSTIEIDADGQVTANGMPLPF